jgi:GNAT superfamily N-acetyltransferase
VIEIRDASPEDADRIAEIIARAWRTAYRGIIEDDRLAGLPVKAWEREIRGNIERLEGGSFAIVAELDSELAGSCYVVIPARDGDLGPDVAELVAISVDPAHWRQGIGRALVAEALGRAARVGSSEISLWTLSASRQAQAFYEQLGWRPDGNEQVHPVARVPTLRMRRPVP